MSCCPTTPACKADECCPPQDYGYGASKLEVWMIADFGVNTTNDAMDPATDPNALAVANLVKQSDPDLLLMAGDCRYNNDYVQTVSTLYGGLKGAGKLLPTPGNHDWDYGGLSNYLAYFNVNRYYSRRIGPVEFFMLDSGYNTSYVQSEPDGIIQGTVVPATPACCGGLPTLDGGSTQWQWFNAAVDASSARWKVVGLHHPPLASGNGHWGTSAEVSKWGSHKKLQWEAFKRKGINLVLSGHEHSYERLDVDGVIHIVNGLGGKSIYGFGDPPLDQSRIRYAGDFGALRLIITPDCILGRFMSVSNQIIDEFQIIE